MRADIERLIGEFSQNVRGVEELLDFDQLVLEHIVGGLDSIADRLEQAGKNNDARDVRHRLATVRNIRAAGSLRPKYETMLNQCVVLLVSYFGSTVEELFRTAVSGALTQGLDVPVADETVKLTWRHLAKPDLSVAPLLTELVVEQQAISFQDMQSIGRAFSDNLRIDLGRPAVANDIILGQAARHVIVHAACVVSSRMVKQVKAAMPRTLKRTLQTGQRLQFDKSEIVGLASAMTHYVQHVADRVEILLNAT